VTADDLPDSHSDHIGEKRPFNPDGSCPARFVVNKSRDSCVFLGRIDVIQNYVKTGGFDGGKYSIDRLYQNANSFIKPINSISSSTKLLQSVSHMCGAG